MAFQVTSQPRRDAQPRSAVQANCATGAACAGHPILALQRVIGNRGVSRLLDSGGVSVNRAGEAGREMGVGARAVSQLPQAVSAHLQRACLDASQCRNVRGQSALTRAVLEDPAQQARERERLRVCGIDPLGPVQPGCRADRHSDVATNVVRLVREFNVVFPTSVRGIFIDRDIPNQWRAYRGQCDEFVPSVGGPHSCIFVPLSMEEQAEQFHNGDQMIGGLSRDEWRLENLRILMHETGHAFLRANRPHVRRRGACEYSEIRSEIQEIAADMEEFWTAHEVLGEMELNPLERARRLAELMDRRYVSRARRNWRQIRCVCNCQDANDYVRQTAQIMTPTWPTWLKYAYHSRMRQSIRSWPVVPQRPPDR